MSEPLFEVEAPAAVDVPRPAREYVPEPRTAIFLAFMQQQEPNSRERGWVVFVDTHRDYRTHEHYRPVLDHMTNNPSTRITQPGLRAPRPEQRAEALQRLGFELAPDSSVRLGSPARWEWLERETLNGKGIVLYATAEVRRIR